MTHSRIDFQTILLDPETPQTDFIETNSNPSMVTETDRVSKSVQNKNNITNLFNIIIAKIFDELINLYMPWHQPGAFVENLEEEQQALADCIHSVFFADPQRFSKSNYEVFSLIKSHKKISFTMLIDLFVKVGIPKEEYQFMVDDEGKQLYGFLKPLQRSFGKFADELSIKFMIGSKVIVKEEGKLVAWVIAYNHKRYQDHISKQSQIVYPTAHHQTHTSSTQMINQSLQLNNPLLSEVDDMQQLTEALSPASIPLQGNATTATKRHYIEIDAQEESTAKKQCVEDPIQRFHN